MKSLVTMFSAIDNNYDIQGKFFSPYNYSLHLVPNATKHIGIFSPRYILTWHFTNSLRITFKVALLAFKCKHGLAPTYLNDLILNYVPTRSLELDNIAVLLQGSFVSRNSVVKTPRN